MINFKRCIVKIFNKLRVKKMAAPPPISINEVIFKLNVKSNGEYWIPIDGYYVLSACDILGSGFKIKNDPPTGLVYKVFLNKKTGEIRTYLAKYLDIPERDNLW